ncbi:MAG: DUF222 domain-containing protein [Nocardioides sp.]|uniref:HNH endonuclease signature motif containing protein n=1 Tax=Nocardioides sp. TaxID=35761 RepID=UPI003EFC494E
MATRDKAAALVSLSSLESRLVELRLRVSAESADVASDAGARDVAAWAARHTRRRRAECAAELRLAHSLADAPLLAGAVRRGAVTIAQASAVAASLAELPSGLPADVPSRAEAALVEHAADLVPTDLRRLGRRILEVVAPDVAEEAEARALADLERSARDRMRLGLRSLGDGTWRISGLIPEASAARLATYLHAFTNPRAAAGAEDASPCGDGTAVPAEPAGAPRPVPYGRRTAEAFCQLLETLDPRRLPLHGGDATTLVVTLSIDALRTDLAAATLGGDGGHDRISAQEARRLACKAQIVPAVLGGDGEVLDLGRSQRLFTRSQRRALLLRDKTCRAQGCDIPGAWTEAHHLVPWSRGGRSDLANGLLLCAHHHHRIHDPAYRATRTPQGRVEFRRRDESWSSPAWA